MAKPKSPRVGKLIHIATMEAQKVDMFMLMNSKFFESYQLPVIRDRLIQIDDSKWGMVQITTFKDPTTAIILSVLTGVYGVDRFYIGDTGLGIAKLLTCGGLGIWAFVDWFLIMGATRQKNYERLQSILI